ncbi:hypothetical protein GCM10007269_33910 [Microbacterium murale]|uniref:DUF2127 domain-containing protein n=1 Tax=Microbacterium murale TaxID=1081040 RepID=A0ABQ1S203_9MICO|nr:hypothetical protein GCM10007269_33910 [Microbacterium murale]
MQWLALAVLALVVVLVALPIAMFLDPQPYAASIERSEPALGAAAVANALQTVRISTAVAHGVYAVVAVWLTVNVLRGRNWARITLTIVVAGATLNSVTSALAGPEYYLPVIVGDVLHVAIVCLLWFPRRVREFFTRQRIARGRTRA